MTTSRTATTTRTPRSSADPPVSIQIEGLRLRRRRHFLLSIEELSLDAGINLLVGPNGAGKTSLLECLSGSHSRSVGRLRIDGRDIKAKGVRDSFGRRLGYAPQALVLPPHWSVSSYLGYSGWLKGLPSRAAHKQVTALVDSFELQASARIGKLSGGMKRRVLLAQAFINRPSYLFIDEPFSGLDDHSKTRVQQHIIESAQSATVVVVDHTAALADTSSRIVRLASGSIA